MRKKLLSRTAIVVSSVIGGMILWGLIQNVDSNTNNVWFNNGMYTVNGQNFKTVAIENGSALFTSQEGKKTDYFMVEGAQKKNKFVTFQNKKKNQANLYTVSPTKNGFDFYLIKKGTVSDKISFTITK